MMFVLNLELLKRIHSIKQSAPNISNCTGYVTVACVHCHAIKDKIKKPEWIKSRNCDIIDDK